VDAVRNSDVRRLCSVPGLGRKTSERLVVELRDRMEELVLAPPAQPPRPAASGLREDAVSALVNLGYRQKDAEAAVQRAEDLGAENLAGLLKAALARLAR
jgi:Holliday junction DNA helicase RuvA